MMGGRNMAGMMKQMQKMQKEVKKTQDALNEQEFVGKSANDYVTATFKGDKTMIDLQINPEVMDPEDPDMAQDLIIDAVNQAITQINQETEQKLGKYTKGLM
ncbi:YbaB/EbfC family nucleoid-associated protein [Holzapfeliella sp. He02]|uniref:Nucleoid-associated protein R4Y45_02775 n=1 Tax=Holzapfeliella saturejae TaxID=3082953 RepID=A0ABU8SGL0_9LACO